MSYLNQTPVTEDAAPLVGDFSDLHLSQLIQALYRCSMDSRFLTSFLPQLANSCLLRSVVVIEINIETLNFNGMWMYGNDQKEIDSELNGELYLKDPMVKKVLQSTANQFYLSNLDIPNLYDVMPSDVVEWSENSGIMAASGALVTLDENTSLMMFFQRGGNHPDFTEKERYFWNLLIPHFKESTGIHHRMNACNQLAQDSPAIINSFPLPVFMIDRLFRVLVTNDHAKGWIERTSLARLESNQLFLNNRRLNNQLRLEMSKLLDAENIQQSELDEYVVKWDTGIKKVMFFLKPIIATAQNSLGVLCFVHDPDEKHSVSCTALQTLFGLSPREAQICQLLSSGMSVNDIAEYLTLSVHTIRGVIKKQIFNKCNCRSQTELISLILSSPAIFMKGEALSAQYQLSS